MTMLLDRGSAPHAEGPRTVIPLRRSGEEAPTPRTSLGVLPLEYRFLTWGARLAAIGCPVVAWRGPGTLDDVLHRLARRAQLPRVAAR